MPNNVLLSFEENEPSLKGCICNFFPNQLSALKLLSKSYYPKARKPSHSNGTVRFSAHLMYRVKDSVAGFIGQCCKANPKLRCRGGASRAWAAAWLLVKPLLQMQPSLSPPLQHSQALLGLLGLVQKLLCNPARRHAISCPKHCQTASIPTTHLVGNLAVKLITLGKPATFCLHDVSFLV